MSDPLRLEDGREMLRWLAEGPDRAPSGLLGRAVAQAGAVRQRPGLVAAALGAPTLGRAWRGISPLRLWLVAGLLLVGAVMAVVVSGGLDTHTVTVRPSATPASSTVPFPGPSPTRLPAPTPADEVPATAVTYFDDTLRLMLPGGATSSEGPDQVELWTATVRVAIDRWTLGEPHSIPGVGEVSGVTLDAIAVAVDVVLANELPPSTLHRTSAQVDFLPAVAWVAPLEATGAATGRPFQVVLVVTNDRVYSIVGYALGSGDRSTHVVQFASLINTLDFLEPFDVVGLAGRIAINAPGTVYVASSTADRLVLETRGSEIFGVNLTIQDAAVGSTLRVAPLAGQTSAFELSGSSLDAYADSLEHASPERFPAAGRARTSIDGHPAFRWSYVLREIDILGPVRGEITLVVVGSEVYALYGRMELVNTIQFNEPVAGCFPVLCGDLRLGAPVDAFATFDESKAGGAWVEVPANLSGSGDGTAARQWSVQVAAVGYGQVALSIGPVTTGAPVPSGLKVADGSGFFGTAGSVPIPGTTLQELEARWNAQFGATTFVPISVDGVAGIKTLAGRTRTALFVHNGYVVAITAWAMLGFDNAPDLAFDQFVSGLSFVR